MLMESGIVLQAEARLPSENIAIQEKDHGVASSSPISIVHQQPVKKPTRQWAAWTRQEEESFFTALRQVGKNFEKITSRVQSKNKDQVRHYYYRLVRRMNKLLGPGLYLDAKNSKDTIAAMLRWWSLLEKYSCKASKLHLKPRRLKIIIEALEHQLLKDRKKSVRKRPHGEYSSTPSTVSNHSRVPGHDNRTVKLVLVDSQNLQKVGSGKTSLKRNVSVGTNRGNNKGDSNTMKPPRQKRKPAVASSAAYKKWEKAAIAGVSLVADAAEHLERTAINKDVEQVQNTSVTKKSSDPVEVSHALPTLSQNPIIESSMHSSMKLKLQLFPIDDGTRRALELDKHNPHLELTLSSRKRISSVLEHLNRKWGNSNVASGELMIFPYGAQRENLVGCPRWTQDSVASAADVHSMLGSPPVFRLRYGWFPTAEHGTVTLQEKAPIVSLCEAGDENPNTEKEAENMSSASISLPSTNYQPTDIDNNLVSMNTNQTCTLTRTNLPNKRRYSSDGPNDNLLESSNRTVNKSPRGKGAGDRSIMRQLGDMDEMRLSNGNAISAGEWADSLTNISVGDLLSGVPQDENANGTDQPVAESSPCLQEIPFSCDSFDAAIAAHISKQRDKMGTQLALASDASSIWDAEETCDAFLFQKKLVPRQETQILSGITSPSTCKQAARTSLADLYQLDEELSDRDGPTDTDNFAQGELMDECMPDPHLHDNQAKGFGELADIYWPESLGPLDLEIPSSKYHSEDIILSDSLGGLNRLIASSLDAFQNCSFFGLDKKDTPATVEAREIASFSNFKIEGGL